MPNLRNTAARAEVNILTIIASLVCLIGTSVWAASANQHDPYDSYGNISWELEKAHLDNFVLFLEHEPDTIGYIVAYAGRKSCRGEAKDRAIRAKQYVTSRGVKSSRVKWIDGGYREDSTIVLQPAALGLLPPIAPTLKRNQVLIIKRCKSNGVSLRKHFIKASR